MASVLDMIKHYQQSIEKYSDDEGKVLRCIDKLFQLRVTVQHLQETGVGRTVNALRKEPGEVGQAARALVLKWKTMVAAEESDQEGDPRNDTSSHNGHGSGKESDNHMQQSRNTHDKDNSSNVSTPKLEQREKPTENGHHSGSKRKYHSSEEEDHDAKKKSRHTSSSDDDKKKVVVKQEKLSNSESSGDDSESSDSDSDSYSSESSQEEVKVKQEIKKERKESPERHKSSSSKHSHSNHDDHKRDSSSSKKHESDKRESDKHSHHKSSSKDMSRQSSESSSKSSSHKHKNSHEKENNSDKRHKSDTSSDEKKEKESKSSSKHSSDKHKSSSHKHENSSERQKSSDRHSSKEHKSSSHTDKAPEKHRSSSEKDSSKHKSKESSSSSKERHSSSSKEKSKERSSSSSKERSSQSNSSEKKHSSGDSKSQNSDKSKHKSEDGSSEKKSKDKSSSSSSHKSKSSSSSSKSKEDVPKKKSKTSNSEESGEDGIDCGSGASFAEALGMAISPTKPKKKSSTRDINSPNNSFINDLSPAALLAPSAKLAPLPMLEISALPEISPNYKPRPPPKLLPHFTDEDAISAGISSKNQRTKVYSGNKVIGKITSLYEMCVQVLQEHIDALEYTGGVPYEILKPVVDRATPQQLFLLEHYNPYLMEDTDHLWQRFCEKNFRNKRRQELESWREMYMRCQEEQEYKLKSLTANIRLTQEAKKAPIKQTKMAYVDSVVKPPRNIARKQAQHGTAHAATASPASRVASLSATPGVLKGGSPRPPPAPSVSASSFNKPKKAPLMQKALQFMRGRKR